MKKNTLISRFILLVLMLANPATLLPMEQQPTSQERMPMEIEHTCSLCLNELPASEFRQLTCGHQFCTACLKDLLRLGLDEEWAQSMATHLRCPQQGCRYQMNESDIQNITGDASRVARYHEILTRLFINANRNMRHCPTHGCEVIYEVGFQPEPVTCRSCQTSYCSYCRQPHEAGAPCQEAPAPQNNANLSAEELQEHQYQEWLRQNTKPCPQCHVNIQKNGGCKHMTCKLCNHEFCWNCTAQWDRNTHPNYFACPAMQDAAQELGNFEPIIQNEPNPELEAARLRIAEVRRIMAIRPREIDQLRARIIQRYDDLVAPEAQDANRRLLIDRAAQQEAEDRQQLLEFAIRRNDHNLVRHLLRQGAEVNIPERNDDDNNPPLLQHYLRAANREHLLIELINRDDIDVNQPHDNNAQRNARNALGPGTIPHLGWLFGPNRNNAPAAHPAPAPQNQPFDRGNDGAEDLYGDDDGPGPAFA